MDSNVAIINYDCGNLRSLEIALSTAGADRINIVSSKHEIAKAERLILPGVGAFSSAMLTLEKKGLLDGVIDFAETGRPLLGICLGMQLLFEKSEEMGTHEGLGLIPGVVQKLNSKSDENRKCKVPNVGWLPVIPKLPCEIFEMEIGGQHPEREYFYFAHSFVTKPLYKHNIVAVAYHGSQEFCAVTRKKNIIGCQFHPEKSSKMGLNVLSNFLKINI